MKTVMSESAILSHASGRLILRALGLAAGLIGAAILVAGLVTGDGSLALRSTGLLVVAVVAVWRLATGGSELVVLVVAMAVLAASSLLDPTVARLTNISYGIVGLGLAAALLAPRRILWWNVSVVGVIAVTRHWLVVEPVEELLIAGGTPLLLIYFGTRLVEWLKDEIVGRETSFENVFDNAPVAMWEEDFSRVDSWLNELRDRGVTDLRSYLAENPEEVRAGARRIHVVNVNDAGIEFLQAPSREVVLGPLDPDLVLEDTLETIIEELVAVWENRPHLRIDVTGASTQGNPLDGYLMMSAPRTPAGIDWSKTVVAIVDIKEQRAAQRYLQDLVDSKDQFVASVSHELRTPLTAVIGLAHELRDGHRIGDEERAELVSVIAEQAVDVGNIVEDLLVAARVDTGTISIRQERLDLHVELSQLLDALRLPDPPKLVIETPAPAWADGYRVRQVLRNLLTNAYRYGGSTVSVRVTSEEGRVVIDVADDGDGIPEALADRIFEPYETAHRAEGVAGSVGLGLTVSRQLARLMGGDLTYLRDQGSTIFRLTLPAG